MTLWEHVIPFGDSSRTLPLAASIAVTLLLGGNLARAVHWLACFGVGVVVIIAGKLAFDMGGWCLPALDFFSISGHAMQTTAIYPLLFTMIGSGLGEHVARWGFYLGLMASLFIATALVAGNYHTLSETVAGATVGAAVVCSYFYWRPSLRPEHLSLLVVLSLNVVLFVDIHDVVHPTKAAIWQGVARWLGASDQYSRRIHIDPETGVRQILMRHGQPL
ncbi:MAG: phosphatase PAP2 family protein [Pseudomonadota bacterium]